VTTAEAKPLSRPQLDYAENYEGSRAGRNKQFDAIFLPLEFLVDRSTGESMLSVSLGGTGQKAIYVTRQVAKYRVAKAIFRWFVIPSTISKVFSKAEFESEFSSFLQPTVVNNEEFWQIPAVRLPALQDRISGHQLDNRFRESYVHGYLSN
jgi:hypothetical protein